jgi:hypothetical protein
MILLKIALFNSFFFFEGLPGMPGRKGELGDAG